MIKWIGKNTQLTQQWTAEGETYQQLYYNIIDKYDDLIIDENILNSNKENFTENDYKDCIEQSKGIAYYHYFDEPFEVDYIVKGKHRKTYKGYIDDIIDDILWSIETRDEDLLLDIENAQTKEELSLVLNQFNNKNKSYIIK